MVLCINLFILPRLLPALFEPSNWVFKKYLLFNGWQILSVGLAFTVLNYFVICEPNGSILPVLLKTQWEVALVAGIPMFFVTFLVRNELLAENLANALAANQQLKALHIEQAKALEHEILLNLITDTTETLSILPSQFIYAEAQDNYTEVFYLENKVLRKKLLRITLRRLAEQLPSNEFVRCHRSFLVNLHHIEEVSGNASGFRISLRLAAREIPVSRSKGLEMGSHLSNK